MEERSAALLRKSFVKGSPLSHNSCSSKLWGAPITPEIWAPGLIRGIVGSTVSSGAEAVFSRQRDCVSRAPVVHVFRTVKIFYSGIWKPGSKHFEWFPSVSIAFPSLLEAYYSRRNITSRERGYWYLKLLFTNLSYAREFCDQNLIFFFFLPCKHFTCHLCRNIM